MLLPSLLRSPRHAFTPTPAKRRRGRTQLHVERLEERHCPSGGYLLVTDWVEDTVLRYDEATGAFIDTFVTKHSGGLNDPIGVVFGHDHNLYVSSGQFSGPGQLKGVPRYEGTTGGFLDVFTENGHLTSPRGIIFGPEGNLYVADATYATDGTVVGRVVRYNGTTGRFMDDFVPTGSGGLSRPGGLLFGPNGKKDGKLDLYVASPGNNRILRYDVTTGAFLGEFVSGASGWLDHAGGITFGPDGNLYVANWAAGVGHLAVLRFQGPTGRSPGAPMPSAGNSGADFVPVGSGGLLAPFGLLFGPDGNGDGRQDLYVTNTEYTGAGPTAKQHTANVKRYDGVTGAFIDTFVPAGSGGLRDALFLTFAETDAVTLAYTGGRLTAAAISPDPVNEILSADQVQPLLTEAFARWQGAGLDTSSLSTIDVRIADLPGATLGEAVGHTIYLDTNAAGWGWFIDATAGNDSEYLTPGDQGEQGRMDLLTAVAHELGHLLGYEHSDAGTMHDTLATGERHAPTSNFGVLEPVLVDLVLFEKKKAWVNEPLANDPLHDVASLLQ